MSEEAIVQKNLGNEAYKKLDFVNAHKHYDAAILLSPNNCIFYSNKAAVFFHEGKFQECIDQCKKAIEIGREYQADCKLIAKAMTRIGKTFFEIKNFRGAMHWYKESVAVYRNSDIAEKLAKLELKEAQNWPSDVFKWIKANANPKMALKLMQCSKYFCHPVFPYLVVKQLTFSGFNIKKWYCITLDGESNREGPTNSIEHLTKKFWLTGSLWFNPESENLLSSLIPKIAVCDIDSLMLSNQNITYAEFQYLISSNSIKKLQLLDTSISKDNAHLSIDEILGCVPDARQCVFGISYHKPFITAGIFAKIIEKIKTSKLRSLAISGVNSFADLELLFKFLEKNPQLSINFTFADCLNAEQTKFLQNYVDRIIAAGITKEKHMHKISRLCFFGQTDESREKLSELIAQQTLGFLLFPA